MRSMVWPKTPFQMYGVDLVSIDPDLWSWSTDSLYRLFSKSRLWWPKKCWQTYVLYNMFFLHVHHAVYVYTLYVYIYIWYKDVYLIIFWWKCTAFALPFETCSPLHAQLPHLTISSWNSATKTPSPSACADKPETWQEVGDWPMDGSERERESR